MKQGFSAKLADGQMARPTLPSQQGQPSLSDDDSDEVSVSGRQLEQTRSGFFVWSIASANAVLYGLNPFPSSEYPETASVVCG